MWQGPMSGPRKRFSEEEECHESHAITCEWKPREGYHPNKLELESKCTITVMNFL